MWQKLYSDSKDISKFQTQILLTLYIGNLIVLIFDFKI